jgi:hypothetical protein
VTAFRAVKVARICAADRARREAVALTRETRSQFRQAVAVLLEKII